MHFWSIVGCLYIRKPVKPFTFLISISRGLCFILLGQYSLLKAPHYILWILIEYIVLNVLTCLRGQVSLYSSVSHTYFQWLFKTALLFWFVCTLFLLKRKRRLKRSHWCWIHVLLWNFCKWSPPTPTTIGGVNVSDFKTKKKRF